jgi:ubiquinone/menaquinone biosynthesis C-methylase UbiE
MKNPVGTKNASTRDRWIESVVREIPSGARILDAGAGEQQYKSLCSHLTYISQDFAKYTGDGDSAGLQKKTWHAGAVDLVCDITSIPEPDESFDAVMCTEVLEHLPDPLRALRELTRLLKRDGLLILTAPFDSLTHFSPHFFCTGFGKNYYAYWLERLGYAILSMEFNGNYFEYVAQELRRIPAMAQKYSGLKAGWLSRASSHCILNFLKRASGLDRGSSELCSYGIHVLARKTGSA